MFFNLFRTSKAKRAPGKICMTEARKDQAVVQEILARCAKGTVLLVVHFDQTLERIRPACENVGIELSEPIRTSSEIYSAARGHAERRALLIRSRDCRSLATMSKQDGDSKTFAVIVADMHPLFSREQQVDAVADALPGKTTIVRFGSMEDPIMKRYAGESTIKVLKFLGVDEDTVLEDQRIMGAVVRAQKRIERDARNDHDAASSHEWFKRNLPTR